jgi:hypothetical protein
MCVCTRLRLCPEVRLTLTVAFTVTVTTVLRPGPGLPECHRDGHGSKFQVQKLFFKFQVQRYSSS